MMTTMNGRRTMHLATRFLRLSLALLMLSAMIVANARSAGAATSAEWSVAPYYNGNTTGPRDWFQYTLKPGQTMRDIVSVSNLSNQNKSFYIYPSDASNTPLDGAFALGLRKDRPKSAGSWIRLGYKRFDLKPHTRAAFPFQISVPTNAQPGDTAAGIVVEDAKPDRKKLAKDKGVNILNRVGARVYIRVAGPLAPAVEVTKIVVKLHKEPLTPWGGGASAEIGYRVKNVGNVRLTPTSQLTMKGLFGRTLKSYAPHQLPELVPGGSVDVTERWNGLPYLDRVQAKVHVTALAGTVSITRTKSVFVGPWWLVAVAIGLLLVAFAIWLWRRRRRGRANADEGALPAPAPKPASAPPANEPVGV
jgi:hypothetical protein